MSLLNKFLCKKEPLPVAGMELKTFVSKSMSDIVSSATALFLHNIKKEYPDHKNQISFLKAPLAFVLILCDIFQEWDRYSEKKEIFGGDEFNIECDGDQITLFVPETIRAKVRNEVERRLVDFPIFVNK